MATERTIQPPATGRSLLPGDVACAGRGERLETLLGSCVAIILTDPRRTVGAMCHIVHGEPVGRPVEKGFVDAGSALREMFRQLQARGISPALCHAYVFGGGNMFPKLYSHTHVGDQNAQSALACLESAGVQILMLDLGGRNYRRLGWTVGPGAPEVVAVPV